MAGDRARILRALDALKGYVVADGCGSTVTDGWSEIIGLAELELDEPARDFPCVFWTEDAARNCFDAKGTLIAPLTLHWRGDRRKIGKALAATKLPVDVPKDESATFRLKPKKSALRGEWLAVPASALRAGDVVRDDVGIGRVTLAAQVGDQIRLYVERGGGFMDWSKKPSEKVKLKPRPRDDDGNLLLRAEGLRAGDEVLQKGEPVRVKSVKSGKPGRYEITLASKKTLRLAAADEVAVRAAPTDAASAPPKKKAKAERRTMIVRSRDLRANDVLVDDGASAAGGRTGRTGERTVVRLFVKNGALHLSTKPGGTKKISFVDEFRVALPRPDDAYEWVDAKELAAGDEVHLDGKVTRVSKARTKVVVTYANKTQATYAPAQQVRRRRDD